MHLILATSCPPTFLGEKGTKFIVDYLGGNDFYGSWAHPRNMPELLRLLGLLKEWKARKPGGSAMVECWLRPMRMARRAVLVEDQKDGKEGRFVEA